MWRTDGFGSIVYKAGAHRIRSICKNSERAWAGRRRYGADDEFEQGYFSSNKLGFLDKEDLGDGWNAHSQLENGFNLDNGQHDNTTGIEFNRQAFVGIGNSKYGSIALGRRAPALSH